MKAWFLKNLANVITGIGLVSALIAVIFALAFFTGGMFWICIIIALVSDALDGHIARSRHIESRVGCVLDMIRDRVLLIVVFTVIVFNGSVD